MAVIAPISEQHATGAIREPIFYILAYVANRVLDAREQGVPRRRSWTDPERSPRGTQCSGGGIRIRRFVLPIEEEHVFREFGDQLWIVVQHVGPHHDAS